MDLKDDIDYKNHWKDSLLKLFSYCDKEGVIVIFSRNTPSNYSKIHYSICDEIGEVDKEIVHIINIQNLPDNKDMLFTIVLSHEIGHYLNNKKESKTTIDKASHIAKIFTEINAWVDGERLLVDMGIVNRKGNSLQRRAYSDFNKEYVKSISTYFNPLNSIKSIILDIRLLFVFLVKKLTVRWKS